MKYFLPLLGLCLCAMTTMAQLKLADAFSDHMVLQRDRPIPVWGSGLPGETVRADFGGVTRTTRVDGFGRWRLDLPPFPAGGPFQLQIQGADHAVTISDILVGEVWLISGQSNADMAVQTVNGGAEALAAGNNPHLRIHEIFRTPAATPQNGLLTRWAPVTPGSFPNFSAVGYFFADRLQRELGVPVGIIGSTWGGTGIGVWMSERSYRGEPGLAGLLPRVWPAEITGQPTTLYNAMIHPLAPAQLGGVIWYQGEADMLTGSAYAAKLRALIAGWRESFENPELPFFIVELAPYHYALEHPVMLPEFWTVQRRTAEADPHVYSIAINDLGDPADIHPRRKREVGERIALAALAEEYAAPGYAFTAPEVEKLERDGAELRLYLTADVRDTVGDGAGFEVAGPDRVYHPARVTVGTGPSLTLTSPAVAQPEAFRYDWTQDAVGAWRTAAGLPLATMQMAVADRAALRPEVPEAAGFELLYELDLLKLNLSDDQREARYEYDNSAAFATRRIRRIGYFLYAVTANREVEWLWAALDPFTGRVEQMGLPTVASGARFHQAADRVTVRSNLARVPTGDFERGYLKFYPEDDAPAAIGVPGYGKMQLFTEDGRTIFAYNHWRLHQPGVIIAADIGLGQAPDGVNSDWMSAFNWKNFQSATLQIYVECE